MDEFSIHVWDFCVGESDDVCQQGLISTDRLVLYCFFPLQPPPAEMLFVNLCRFVFLTILIERVHRVTFPKACNHGEKFVTLLLLLQPRL